MTSVPPADKGAVDGTESRQNISATSDSDSDQGEERALFGIITDIQNGLSKRFRDRTQHLGVSRSQWRVLSALAVRPGATQTEIADLIGIGRAPLGKIVDRLEAQGWLERRSDPDDRRVNRLYLCRDVAPVSGPTRQISNEIVEELLEVLPVAEQEAFRKVLAHMHTELGFRQP